MLTLADVIARIQRLDELTRGLAKEVLLWREADDPLLYLERRAYLNAIQDMLAGAESARVLLARARQRIESILEAASAIEQNLPRSPPDPEACPEDAGETPSPARRIRP